MSDTGPEDLFCPPGAHRTAVGNQKTVFFRVRQLGNRTLLEMDQVIHTGQLCVLSGTLDDISVDIKA